MIGSHLECAAGNPDHVVTWSLCIGPSFGKRLNLKGLHKGNYRDQSTSQAIRVVGEMGLNC